MPTIHFGLEKAQKVVPFWKPWENTKEMCFDAFFEILDYENEEHRQTSTFAHPICVFHFTNGQWYDHLHDNIKMEKDERN